MLDPDVVVLGGGMSNIAGLPEAASALLPAPCSRRARTPIPLPPASCAPRTVTRAAYEGRRGFGPQASEATRFVLVFVDSLRDGSCALLDMRRPTWYTYYAR